MHLTLDEALDLAASIRDHVSATLENSRAAAVICAPFPYLSTLHDALRNSSTGLGAQNMHAATSGAFTGEVSAPMLLSVGCDYVILGHSERRQYFHEDDAIVNLKLTSALAHGLRPIVCVGETLEQREQGVTENVVEAQMRASLAGIDGSQLQSVILAYEPVWAIGTGKTATPEQAQDVHAFLRALVARMYDSSAADALIIQYGGSVKADNAMELFSRPDVDGGLVGGASLDADAFAAIIDAARACSEG
jgi:triosephosphate isomerase (TIM)